MTRQIKHSQLYIDSLLHPKKLAAYRILSIGKVIQYTFFLILLLSVFSFGQFMAGDPSTFFSNELADFAKDLEFLIYIIGAVFLFSMNTAVIFAKVSIYAYVGTLFAKAMKRRAEYRQLWRTTAFAITWEVVLSMILPLLSIRSSISIILMSAITLSIVFVALTKYPKIPVATPAK